MILGIDRGVPPHGTGDLVKEGTVLSSTCDAMLLCAFMTAVLFHSKTNSDVPNCLPTIAGVVIRVSFLGQHDNESNDTTSTV